MKIKAKYTLTEFGELQAYKYKNLIYEEMKNLSSAYLMYPECRYLRTKQKLYRAIFPPAHFILYRITPMRIVVLDIISYRSSIS